MILQAQNQQMSAAMDVTIDLWDAHTVWLHHAKWFELRRLWQYDR